MHLKPSDLSFHPINNINIDSKSDQEPSNPTALWLPLHLQSNLQVPTPKSTKSPSGLVLALEPA
jgi:hypothetical protein